MADWFIEPVSGDTNDLFTFFNYVNNATGGLFFPVILLVIWVISFVAMLFSGNYQRPSAAKAWTFASFFAMVLSIPLAVLDVLSKRYMYITIVMLGIGALWLILEGKGN